MDKYLTYTVSVNSKGQPKLATQQKKPTLRELAYTKSLERQLATLKELLFASALEHDFPAAKVLTIINHIRLILEKMEQNPAYLKQNGYMTRKHFAELLFCFKRLPEEFLATYEFLLPAAPFSWDHFDVLTHIVRPSLMPEPDRPKAQEILVFTCLPGIVDELIPQLKRLFTTIEAIEKCKLGKQTLATTHPYQLAAEQVKKLDKDHGDEQAKQALKTIISQAGSLLTPIALTRTFFLIRTISDCDNLTNLIRCMDELGKLPRLPLKQPLVPSQAVVKALSENENRFLLSLSTQQVKSAFFSYLSDIGELCKNTKLSKSLKNQLPQLPWQALMDLRDHLEHPNEKGKANILANLTDGQFNQMKVEIKQIRSQLAAFSAQRYAAPAKTFYQQYVAHETSLSHPPQAAAASISFTEQEKAQYKKTISTAIRGSDKSRYLSFIDNNKVALPNFSQWLLLTELTSSNPQQQADFHSARNKIEQRFVAKLQAKVALQELMTFLALLKNLTPAIKQQYAACLDDTVGALAVPSDQIISQDLVHLSAEALTLFQTVFYKLTPTNLEKIAEQLDKSTAPRVDRRLRYIEIAHSAIESAHDFFKFTIYHSKLQNTALNMLWSTVILQEIHAKAQAKAQQTGRPFQEVYSEIEAQYQQGFSQEDYSMVSPATFNRLLSITQTRLQREAAVNFEYYLHTHPLLKEAVCYQLSVGLSMLKEIRKFADINYIPGFKQFLDDYYLKVKRARNELSHGNTLLENIVKPFGKNHTHDVIKAVINPSGQFLQLLSQLKIEVERAKAYEEDMRNWQEQEEAYNNYYGAPTL